MTAKFFYKTLSLCTEDSAGGFHSLLKISFNHIVKSTATSTPVFINSFVSPTKLYHVPPGSSTDNRSALPSIPTLNTYHCCCLELVLIRRNEHFGKQTQHLHMPCWLE
ncbi:unnamed protein product, partial [Vitis vinifera]|uniref:Uncharacterized protein n=1 Tax=Vitis vinifera TaxID=29760 RepID=D7U666_VITVI